MKQSLPSLTPLEIQSLLKRFNLRPDRRLGQNFLVEQKSLGRVAAAAEISPQDWVLEIGAGLGSLTRYLAALAGQVIAVELDPRLIAPLRHVLNDFPNVRLVQGDMLALNPQKLLAGYPQGVGEYLVVANIPYYITSALLRHLLEAPLRPDRMVLTVQREVAERICASPGKMSLLALSVQVYGQPKISAYIPSGAFYPAPKVDSAVVRVDLYNTPRIPIDQLDNFFRLAKAGFSQKRKMLRNSLSAGMRWSTEQTQAQLLAAGIEPRRRAETLSLEEWGELTRVCLAADENGSRDSSPKDHQHTSQ